MFSRQGAKARSSVREVYAERNANDLRKISPSGRNDNFFLCAFARHSPQLINVVSRDAPTWLIAPTMSPTQTFSSWFAGIGGIAGFVLSGFELSRCSVSPPMT